MKVVYLTGFMGSGKSTIGRLLSKKLGVQIVDTDELIMQNVGKNITTIFAEEGEEVFRNYESNVLKELPLKDIIVSTGGGIVLREENRQYMKNSGLVIHLDCDFQTIVERLQHSKISKDTRPLFQNDIQNLERRYLMRKKLYYDADCIINTNTSIEHVVESIVEWIVQNGE